MPSSPLTVVADPRFRDYDFGPGHPWDPTSRWLAVRLLEAWEADGVLPSPLAWRRDVATAPESELLRFHSLAYLDRVRAADRRGSGELLDHGDTPSFPGCFDAAARVVQGTLSALKAILEGPGQRAFQPAGGLHHAGRDRASGFCIFNDIAVTIERALAEARLDRVAYVDIDVHHGDGVMYGFYGRGEVLDIDFHETGEVLFPGTGAVGETGNGDGAGLKVNVPLPPGVGDEAFEPLFQRIVPTMIRSFRPKLIVLQCGVDAHAGDRLGHLQYTPRAYLGAVSTLAALADEVADGRLLVTGGGGYRTRNVALVLARVGAALDGAEDEDAIPDALPTPWREEFETISGEAAPRSLHVAPALTRSPWNPARESKLVGELEAATGQRFPRRA